MICPNNTNEICGGANAISIYLICSGKLDNFEIQIKFNCFLSQSQSHGFDFFLNTVLKCGTVRFDSVTINTVEKNVYFCPMKEIEMFYFKKNALMNILFKIQPPVHQYQHLLLILLLLRLHLLLQHGGWHVVQIHA